MIITSGGIKLEHSTGKTLKRLSRRKAIHKVKQEKKYASSIFSLALSKQESLSCRENYSFYLNDSFRKII
jgi:hypothetical protein